MEAVDDELMSGQLAIGIKFGGIIVRRSASHLIPHISQASMFRLRAGSSLGGGRRNQISAAHWSMSKDDSNVFFFLVVYAVSTGVAGRDSYKKTVQNPSAAPAPPLSMTWRQALTALCESLNVQQNPMID